MGKLKKSYTTKVKHLYKQGFSISELAIMYRSKEYQIEHVLESEL